MLLFVFGTRPEAIKLCPLIHAAAKRGIETQVCVTAQHRALLDQVLDAFSVKPTYDLNLMTPGQTLFDVTARILKHMHGVLKESQPRLVIVQGDTTTTFAGALAAFYAGIPVAHVEAGLRTGDMSQPFPEEMNRVLTARLAELHFAATPGAAANLAREGIGSETVIVTGNTGIDAVLYINEAIEDGRLKPASPVRLDPSRKLLLVTAHRRESFGEGMQEIALALRRLAAREDVQIVFPVHPNPNVRRTMEAELSDTPNVRLCEPLDYVSFVDAMRRSYILITDSGGVQEEAPSLGKPVLVLRDKTERPEAVAAGTATLVGPHADRIVEQAELLLNNQEEYRRRAFLHNPYGDGQACGRILSSIEQFLS